MTRTGVAVVGAGHWGPHLIKNFADHPEAEVLWVIDTDPDRRAVAAGRYPQARTSGNLDVALGDDAVEAVVIATPTSTHYELVRAALEAGRHVLVEKPITDDVEAARRLCDLASEKDLVLMVGHVFLFNPAIDMARTLIERGELGRVYYLAMRRTNLGPVRVDVNAAWDLAAHDISVANYWLGTGPEAVSAGGGSWINPGIEDAVFLNLRYPDDVMVHIEASWLSPRKVREIAVVGEAKMLTVDDMNLNEPVRIYDKRVEGPSPMTDTFVGFRSQVREGTVTIPRVPMGEPLRAEVEEFVRRVQGSDGTLSDGRFGLGVVEALAAADRSLAEGGRLVALDEVSG